MTVNDPALLTILVFLIAGLFLVQTLFLLVFVDRVNRRIRKLDRTLVRTSKKISRGIQTANDYVQQLSRTVETLPDVVHRVDGLLDTVVCKLRSFSGRASRDLHWTTSHLEETGRRIELALHQFTRQTSKVRKWIRYPGNWIAAIIHGAFTGVKTYSRDSHRRQPATHYPDDEIFI